MNISENLTEKNLIKEYPDRRRALKRMFESLKKLPPEDQAIVLRALGRYEKESKRGSYKTKPGTLAQFIIDEKLIEDSNKFMDLGAGPGDLLKKLGRAYPFVEMLGVDLSPGFVTDYNRENSVCPGEPGFRDAAGYINVLFNAWMEVGLIDSPMFDNDFGLDEKGTKASVVSILTLDRLTNPGVLIKNMARFNRAKILGTLLPVVPEDDNPSRQGEEKIVYTRPPNRIVPGRTATKDRDALLRVLKDVWKKPVDVENVPYEVTSSGDTQKYDLAVFYSR